MSEKLVVLRPPIEEHNCGCPVCKDLSLRVERNIRLHAQTACQLAEAEAFLVESKRECRVLKKALVGAIASIRYLGGNPQELQDLIEGEPPCN